MNNTPALHIRSETPADVEAIYQVVKSAFAGAEHCDGNEQDLVDALRAGDSFIPALSLVAERGGQIVGHILFTKLRIGAHTELALAPLSVRPGCQRQGIGTALIRAGHARARALGYHYSVVLGSDAYYARHGYVPADTFGILPCFDVPRQYFMACRLTENAPRISGVVQYAAEFNLGCHSSPM